MQDVPYQWPQPRSLQPQSSIATASLFGELTAVATKDFTTIFSLPGQTVTIFPPTVTAGELQYPPYLMGSILPPLYAVTVTEVDAFVQAPGGTI
jgi:hypothetical protein